MVLLLIANIYCAFNVWKILCKELYCNIILASFSSWGNPILGTWTNWPKSSRWEVVGIGFKPRHFRFPGGSDRKESACISGNPGSISGSGISPGEGNGPHSSILAWEIPRTEEPGGVQSTGLPGAGHDWANIDFCIYTLKLLVLNNFAFLLPLASTSNIIQMREFF